MLKGGLYSYWGKYLLSYLYKITKKGGNYILKVQAYKSKVDCITLVVLLLLKRAEVKVCIE